MDGVVGKGPFYWITKYDTVIVTNASRPTGRLKSEIRDQQFFTSMPHFFGDT